MAIGITQAWYYINIRNMTVAQRWGTIMKALIQGLGRKVSTVPPFKKCKAPGMLLIYVQQLITIIYENIIFFLYGSIHSVY